jgi:Xaa-Pro aminopeptidase
MAVEPLRVEGQADFPRFSEGEYARRYAALREAMAARDLDALVVWGESSGWGELSGARIGMANARYVSNFADQLREYVLFPRDGEPMLFTFSRSHSVCARDISVVPIEYSSVDIAMSVSRRIQELGLEAGRIGLVGTTTIFGQSLPVDQHERFLAELPKASLVNATELLETVRARKGDEECDWIGRAVGFTDLAFEALLQTVEPGMPEHVLHARIAHAYLPSGGHMNYQALGATAMAAPDLLSPSYQKSRLAFRPGDVVLAEISAGYWGYGGFLARPVAVGGPVSNAYAECFEIASSTLSKIAEALRPGLEIGDAAAALADNLPAGWTNATPVIRGWGLGAEPPHVASDGTVVAGGIVEEDMVLAVAVNPVSPDRRVGLRLGDLYRIAGDGAVRLHAAPLEFFNV